VFDFQTTSVYNPNAPSYPFASVYIEHTYIGDLNVTIGVGPTAAPYWSKVVWNRQGGSTDNLNLIIDLSAAVNYLPPSGTYRWFLRVYDGGTGDQGRIMWFNITHQGQTYASSDVPVNIADFKTSYAYMPSAPSVPFAHVYIQHTYITDLIVDIGVGNTTSPQWSNRIWNGTGGKGPGYLDLTIDLTDATAYLPPSSSNTWFLKVYDRYTQDTGTIVEFTIKYMGTTYVSTDVPVPILDKQTSYAYISG
jgi:subtilisin-like proprotein convertase family protein